MRVWFVLLTPLVLAGCPAPSPANAPERPACADLTLAAITAECQAQISELCKGLTEDQCDEKTDVLRKCDARIEEWQRCQ
jgi:hypothetical protein